MKIRPCSLIAAACFLSFSAPFCPAGVISYVKITNDADSGIDSTNTYTHALDFDNNNTGVTVNGVVFSGYRSADSGTLNFSRSVANGTLNDNPGTGLIGTTSGDLLGLMGGFLFNNGPATDGTGLQTYTISGLTAGTTYDARLYSAQWRNPPSRANTLVFDPDGAGGISDSTGVIDQDAPTTVGLEALDAYYINYRYTAVAEDLVITVANETGSNASWHLYGLTNQLAPGFSITAAPLEFTSTVTQGDLISDLVGAQTGVGEATTFEFATGDGDEDNGLFQIAGQELQAGTHDFSGDPDGTQYSVRLRGTGNVSAESAEAAFLLTLNADSDADGLPDAWELANADDLTELSGLGGANFDMDTLTDLEEFQISTSTFPGINPKLADTDGDTLEDGSEIVGAGARPPTDPTDADSDDDDLDDGVETNTGDFVNAMDTGTDPTDNDSDGDSYQDGVEVAAGSDPTDAGSVPPLPPGFNFIPITNDEDSGISSENTYTHAIDFGTSGAAMVNGVEFSDGTPGEFPGAIGASTVGTGSSTLPNNHPGNAGQNVTGSVASLLQDMLYNNATGEIQLTGLTPGVTYDFRYYMRQWTAGAVSREQDFLFDGDGDGVFESTLRISQDDATQIPPGLATENQAYALSFIYTAGASGILNLQVNRTPTGGGTFHLYGLTNQVATSALDLRITSITHTGGDTPTVEFTFNSRVGANYKIEASTDLQEAGTPGGWIELDDSYPSEGETTTFVDTLLAGSAPRVFYRVSQN